MRHAAGVLERFTEPARQVVGFAQEEARLLRRGRVGTEHLLVGIARLEGDVAADLLHGHGLTAEQARGEVARAVGVGDAEPGVGDLPFTSAARNALDAALREALELGHAQIEPAHLLLAVLRQPDAVARRVVATTGAHPPQVRAEVIARLGRDRRDVPADAAPADAVPVSVDAQRLLEILERRGPVAAWLRERGVDEQAVRGMLGR